MFSTCEAEIHLVDGKGIMIADSIELSIDESHHHGEDVMALFAQLQQAQTLGTRVRISVVREAFVIDWRAHTSRLVVKVEALP